ncbi:MAG: hypothetical protein ACXVXO_00750 [Mycobacteriaceae bacterium]
MTRAFKRHHEQHVDVDESKAALAEALSRRARTRRVSIAVGNAIAQNHFTADIETIMEGPR